MTAEPKKQAHKVVFDHGTHCEIADPAGNMKRYSRDQVETLKALMPDYQFNTVVFRDYSKAGTNVSDK
jgi:hypothetical protein